MSDRLLKRNNSGSVYSLRPDLPIDCFTSCSILEASKIMTENRVHCLIIKDVQTKRIRGLVTAKDLAFRVVAMDINDVSRLTVDTIMTINPYVSSINTSANDALRLMVEKRIRHLPLIDDNSGIVKGVLNITKCFYHAMIRLEKMSLEAEKLQNTFEDLQNVVDNYKNGSGSRKNSYSLINRDEHGQLIEQSVINNPNSQTLEPLISDDQDNVIDFSILEKKRKIVNDLKRLIDLMTQPDLKSILQDPDLTINRPIFISSRSSVLNAAKLLKTKNLTAVLISDEIDYNNKEDYNKDKVIGILTTKDLAFRVLALNIDPKTTSVARVMTPKPNFANENLTIHKALRMMYEGKFLNLPIMSKEKNEITGIVSVLQLTYSLLKILDGNSNSFGYNLGNNSSTMINSNPNDFIFEQDEAQFESFGNNSNNSQNDSGFREGPAWKQFWGSLDQPLSTVESNEKLSLNSRALSITRSSISSADHSHSLPYPQQRQKSFSYQSVPKFGNSQIDEESYNDDGSVVLINNNGSSTSSSNFIAANNNNNNNPNNNFSGKNSRTASISKDMSSLTSLKTDNDRHSSNLFSSKLEDTTAYLSPVSHMDVIFLKIKIKSNFIDFNNKIFKMKLNLGCNNSDNRFKGVLEKVQTEVMKKLSIQDANNSQSKSLKMDMSYIDEEHDVISIIKDEDLENAIDLVMNIQHKKYLSILMNIKRNSYKNNSLIDIPNGSGNNDVNNSRTIDYDYESNDRIIGILNSVILTSSIVLLGVYIFQKTFKNS